MPLPLQVAWTADDWAVVAAASDGSLRVWRSRSGEPVHVLAMHAGQVRMGPSCAGYEPVFADRYRPKGFKDRSAEALCVPRQAHVLDPHPSDPRLVLSGGYDGRTVLWDVVAGVPLRV